MAQPRLLQLHSATDGASAAEAAASLLRVPASLPPKFFYDAQGSRLFDAITELSEYYPTRTESDIFAAHGTAIADEVRSSTGLNPVIVDLGAGNCAKAAALFPLLAPRRYVAVDISADYLAKALAQLQNDHPALDLVGVGLDFSSQLALPGELTGPGLPDGQEQLLRQAFARGDVSRASPGLGLGLSVVAQTTARLRGELQFSRDDAGHHACVSLPIA
jgi:uncharacterized SAM-dependent methyltransferase